MKRNTLIFNIQHYSLHDGPGIRTVVFLKGCPLRCRWCCNPESQRYEREISYLEQKCIGKAECGFCKSRCQAGAIEFLQSGKAWIDRGKCHKCLECAHICPSQALKIQGREEKIEEILDRLSEEAAFYRYGEGGLTVSGGEPLSHRDFLIPLLKEAGKRRIHRAMETCGYGEYQTLFEAAQHLEVILFDIKSMNEEKHIQYTGKSNWVILDNFQRLCEDFPKLPKKVRTPVIPGFNDTEKELRQIQAFLLEKPNVTYEMLPYHRFGEGKYRMLGRDYEMGDAVLSEKMKKYIERQE